MIYLDSSVALAHLLAEDKRPPDDFWSDTVVASRLLEYEIWTALNGRKLGKLQEEDARRLIGRTAMVELIPEIVARAKERFPIPVRTLDALHLATCAFLLEQGQRVELASYDDRMVAAARKLTMPLYEF